MPRIMALVLADAFCPPLRGMRHSSASSGRRWKSISNAFTSSSVLNYSQVGANLRADDSVISGEDLPLEGDWCSSSKKAMCASELQLICSNCMYTRRLSGAT